MGRFGFKALSEHLVPLVGVGLLLAATALSALERDRRAAPHDIALSASVVDAAGDVAFGRADAPERVVVLVSATCPHCARWEREEMPSLLGGPVASGAMRLVVRQFPLDGVALRGAALLGCFPQADRAGVLESLARSGPLQPGREPSAWRDAARCADGTAARDAALAVAATAASEWGVAATPTFVVGRHVVPGALPAKEIEALAAGR
jgi:protein-disulfide isomerase